MKRRVGWLAIVSALSLAVLVTPTETAIKLNQVLAKLSNAKGCLSCHEGIERFTDGPMIEAIEDMGSDYSDPGGCIVCHGGSPTATTKSGAHTGAPKELTEDGGPHTFYPDPGSIYVGERACVLGRYNRAWCALVRGSAAL